VGGQQVQEQAADHRDPQTGVGAELVALDTVAVGQVDEGLDPGVDHVVEEALCARTTLQRLDVQLVEEPLVGPERWVGQTSPHATHRLRARQIGVREQVRQERALGPLHGLHDGHQQALAGAEVVDEHAMAGANSGGHLAQAEVGDAVVLDVVDDREEQLFAR